MYGHPHLATRVVRHVELPIGKTNECTTKERIPALSLQLLQIPREILPTLESPPLAHLISNNPLDYTIHAQSLPCARFAIASFSNYDVISCEKGPR